MGVLLISGSTRETGSNRLFLNAFMHRASAFKAIECLHSINLGLLPLFTPQRLEEAEQKAKAYELVHQFRKQVLEADAIVVATPEYAHNVPAALKNAFEWCVASGEFSRKRVIAITVTPQAPRGERCMKSLVWTLQALDATVLVEVPVYDAPAKLTQAGLFADEELAEIVDACLDMIVE